MKRKKKPQKSKRTTKKKTGRSRPMARRKRKAKIKSSGFLNLRAVSKPLSGIAYGFVRENISDMIANSKIGQKLPATQFTDEAVMLGAMFLGRKFGLGKVPIIGNMVRAGENIEWARVGQTLKDMRTGNATGTASSSGSLW